jgi:transcriptional regulator with XRE-family HTH domain
MILEIEQLADDIGNTQAARFGALVREHRKALKMSQDDLALATGVGRRFIVELEGGKSSVQLGRALIVAEAVGLRVFDLMTHNKADNALLPDMPDDEEGTAS